MNNCLRSRRDSVYITPIVDTTPPGSYANMFDHLVQFEPEVSPPGAMTRLDNASPEQTLAAQVATADWLEELGVKSDAQVIAELEQADARKAFSALTTNTDTAEQKAALVQLKTPEAVRHITGMLTAYDWEFIQHAKELRGYTVAKLVEETSHSNPNIRLKALAVSITLLVLAALLLVVVLTCSLLMILTPSRTLRPTRGWLLTRRGRGSRRAHSSA